MAIANSKMTAQGQVSVPLPVRRKLGLSPGSVLEWVEVDSAIQVQRATRHSSEEVHRALFASPPKVKTTGQIKKGIRRRMRAKHVRWWTPH